MIGAQAFYGEGARYITTFYGQLAAEKAGLTKQAVQQFVDDLVRDGIVMRAPDATDARARRVVLTEAGQAAMRDADRIKLQIETRWRDRIGSADFDRLDALLRQVIAD